MSQGTVVDNSKRNRIQSEDLAIHDWYRFVLAYPPHLVRYYIEKFGVTKKAVIFDPFCGTGTTLVEAQKNGIHSYGLEANPIGVFASRVKTYRAYNPETLHDYLGFVHRSAKVTYKHHGIVEPQSDLFDYETAIPPIKVEYINGLGKEQEELIPEGFISPKPLLKVLIIREVIRTIVDAPARDFFLLALAKFIVKEAGNVRFGPEVGRTKPKADIESLTGFTAIAESMIGDVQETKLNSQAEVIEGDARELNKYVPRSLLESIICVITSPPYPNEKDYTRSTRLESVLLDFLRDKRDLRAVKESLLRSNSRNVFVSDRDAENVRHFSSITSIADEIEKRRLDLKKTSGFEKHYPKIVLHYFGGMYRHLRSLKPFLARNCCLAYVVGDQMSFFRVLIPTADLLAEIAESLGYNVREIELWRTRSATATRLDLNENVLILENR